MTSFILRFPGKGFTCFPNIALSTSPIRVPILRPSGPGPAPGSEFNKSAPNPLFSTKVLNTYHTFINSNPRRIALHYVSTSCTFQPLSLSLSSCHQPNNSMYMDFSELWTHLWPASAADSDALALAAAAAHIMRTAKYLHTVGCTQLHPNHHFSQFALGLGGGIRVV